MKQILAGLSIALLSACGAAYISPAVDTNDPNVRVRSLTAESVLIANRSHYHPKTLPAVFFQNAGGAGQLRGAGAVPEPSFSSRPQPTTVALRVPPAVPQETYEIGVGDVLVLATKSAGSTVEELSGLLAAQNRRSGYTVQDDGAIAIPDVGRINLAGLTLEQAEGVLFQQLVANQIDPSFSLEIAEFNSQRVSIGGAVRNPRVASIALTPLYLDEAITGSGGITSSDLQFTTIRIYRDGALYQIPAEEYLSRPELQRTQLAAGDSVFVDTEFEFDQAQAYFAEQITLANFKAQARQQALNELQSEVSLRRAALTEARSNFQSRLQLDAVDRDYVYLTGEVGTPGRFVMPFGRNATLADALFENGGMTSETGNPAQLYVMRGSTHPSEFGAVTAWHLDVSKASNMILATKFELRPNDVVFVAQQPVTQWNRAVALMVPGLLTFGLGVASN